MTREPTIAIMDETFAQNDVESVVLPLRVIQAFLSSQALKAKEDQIVEKSNLFLALYNICVADK
jgi:hypothetical protein